MKDRVIDNTYNKTCPPREKQSHHKIEMEKEFSKKASFNALLGLIFGFIISFISFALLIYKGHNVAAWIGSISIVGLISVFICGIKDNII